jgi:alkanesulfonate monooxygenase SsuD/methylene tetrahydromethanopterin reductase-like flavin-dependent oxidoreductase (luciferase family)
VKGFHLMTLPCLYRQPRLLSGLVRIYRSALARAGHDFTATEVLGRFHIYVAHSLDQALREAEPYLLDAFAAHDGGDSERKCAENSTRGNVVQYFAGGFAIVGDPERCIDTIQRWREEAGLTAFCFAFQFGGMPEEMALTSIRLFAERVMPQFK